MAVWSPWRLFPDPSDRGMLVAPFGPGCYELRVGEQLLLYGRGKNVASRMSSLLPAPSGCGGRMNKHKRKAVSESLGKVEYRTLACKDGATAWAEEMKMRQRKNDHVFKT